MLHPLVLIFKHGLKPLLVTHNPLLCITKTTDATGRVEAAAVKEALDNWGISTDTIIASSFDTTSSNTGVNSYKLVSLAYDSLMTKNRKF